MSGLIRMKLHRQGRQGSGATALSDPAMRFQVDELFVQRRGNVLRREDKLISNN
jgi:hypothetical protein